MIKDTKSLFKLVVRLWDDVWAWPVWSIIKWPFGILVCWFVIFLIWSMEVNCDFSRNILPQAGQAAHQFGGEVKSTLSHLSLSPTEPVKNLK